MRLLTGRKSGDHRRAGKAFTRTYLPGEAGHQPRHCAGERDDGLCLSHDHPGDTPMAAFAGLHEPVTADRPSASRPAAAPASKAGRR